MGHKTDVGPLPRPGEERPLKQVCLTVLFQRIEKIGQHVRTAFP